MWAERLPGAEWQNELIILIMKVWWDSVTENLGSQSLEMKLLRVLVQAFNLPSSLGLII